MRAALFFGIALLLGACSKPTNNIVLATAEGDLVIELYTSKAPVTTANFLKYVEENRYAGSAFYRTVRDDNQAQNNIRIDVIQGGLGFANLTKGLPPVAHETTEATGVPHLDGTISLARGEPGTGSSEFFICVGAQPSLDFGGMRNPDGKGFAAFGRVVKGMDVVRRIHQMPTIQPEGDALEYTSGQILTQPVTIHSARRAN